MILLGVSSLCPVRIVCIWLRLCPLRMTLIPLVFVLRFIIGLSIVLSSCSFILLERRCILLANAKRYTVLVDGKSIYVGPVRSADLVYNSIMSIVSLVPELAQHQILLAFGQVPDLPDPDQTYIV